VSILNRFLTEEYRRERVRQDLGPKSRLTSRSQWAATGVNEITVLPLLVLQWWGRTHGRWTVFPVYLGWLVVWMPVAFYLVNRFAFPLSARRRGRSVSENKARDYALLATTEVFLVLALVLSTRGPREGLLLLSPVTLVLWFLAYVALRRWLRPRLEARYRSLGLLTTDLGPTS
jgi:hypothetical protein